MKVRFIFLATWFALALGAGVRGQFVPGHVFVAESAGKLCASQEIYGYDRIWELDPETGEASLFVQIPEEMCGFLTGLAFTPDGTRLRASSWLQSWILEFDSNGNITVALDASDGIAAPWGFNNLAYDADENFYVVNDSRTILRFAADGGPPTVFADETDGVGRGGAIAFAANGDLYLATFVLPSSRLVRITPNGDATEFDNFGSLIGLHTVTADESGHVYVGVYGAQIFRYDAGNPDTKELLVSGSWNSRHSMTMSPDQTLIYLHHGGRLFGIDPVDGTVTTLVDFTSPPRDGITAGIAVVPIPPPPIPTVSAWGVMTLTLLLLIGGTLVLRRRREVGMVQWASDRSACGRGYVRTFSSPFDGGGA